MDYDQGSLGLQRHKRDDNVNFRHVEGSRFMCHYIWLCYFWGNILNFYLNIFFLFHGHIRIN